MDNFTFSMHWEGHEDQLHQKKKENKKNENFHIFTSLNDIKQVYDPKSKLVKNIGLFAYICLNFTLCYIL